MRVEVNGEIRERIAGPASGVRILRRVEDGRIELEVNTHSGEVIKGRYFPPLPSGVCIQEIDVPGQIPDTYTLMQRYKGLLGKSFLDTLERDPETLRMMQHVRVSSNGSGSERWVTRVRRSVPYPAGLFNG